MSDNLFVAAYKGTVDFLSGGQITEQHERLIMLEKSNGKMKRGIDELFTSLDKAATRPTLHQLFPGRSVPIQADGEQRPIGYLQMYQLVDSNYVLDQVINERSKQAFRKAEDAQFHKRFESKCTACGAEYPDRVIESCEVCGNPDIIEPDPTQLTQEVLPGKNVRDFLKECNYNDQRFLDVLKLCYIDEDTVDTGFLIMPKDYVLDANGAIMGYEPKEVIRGDPNTIWPVVDKWGVPGGKYWKCLKEECADEPAIVAADRREGYASRCPKCGGMVHEVHFVGIHDGSPKAYYIKGEVYSWQVHNPNLFAGKSPLIALEKVCRALVKMVEHVWLTYEMERPPKGVLIIPTTNPDSVDKFWKEQMDLARLERNSFPVVATDGERGKPAFIPFSGTMEELQYLQTLEEFRRAISARYGVSLIFQADTSSSGGLNNEGLQITVTNRAIDDIHSNIHTKPMRWTLDQLRVTHWDYLLPKNEEQDEMAEVQRQGAEITNAIAMLQLGYVGTTGKDGGWEFEYDPEKAGELLALGQAQPFGEGGLEEPPEEGAQEASITPAQSAGGSPAEPKRTSGVNKEKTDDTPLFKGEGVRMEKDFATDALKAIDRGVLYDSYKGVSKAVVKRIHAAITAGIKTNMDTSSMTKILEDLGLKEGKAEMIWRTERHAVRMKAREIGWKKFEKRTGRELLFDVVITNQPGRTAEVSKEVRAEINRRKSAKGKRGLPLDEIKDVYEKISTQEKHMGKSWTGWQNFVGHPHERDRIVRVV